jgi:DsbC/DsbD-like thiol-disulfide interchange protein
MPHPALRRLTIVAVTLIYLPDMPAPRAQDASASASAWDADVHAEARLIAGSMIKTADAAYLRAGVEIKLDPGWKTYWRDPGDSGVPPTLDFTDSANVKSVTVLWPAPARFPDGARRKFDRLHGRYHLPAAGHSTGRGSSIHDFSDLA